MIDLEDVIFVIGFASTSYGLWAVSPALAYIIGGIIVMGISFVVAGGDEG